MNRREVSPDPALALLEVYDVALPEVYGYLLARCGDRTTAEELTSETFLGAVTSSRRPGAPPPEIAWLISIARHKLVDHWRRYARERRATWSSDDAHDPWDAALDALRVRDVLADLAPDHREALVLRHVDGLAVPEVAAVLERSVPATESLLARARQAFRRRYDPTVPTPTDQTERPDRGGERP